MAKPSSSALPRLTPRAMAALIAVVGALSVCVCAGAVSGMLLLGAQAAQPAATTVASQQRASPARTAPPTLVLTPTASNLTPTPTSSPVASVPAGPTSNTTTGQPTPPATVPPANTATPAPAASPAPVGQPTFNWKGKVPDALSPLSLPMGSPEYGIQAFLWWRQDLMDRDINLAKHAGFGWIKQNFAWRDIEAAKGHYDWRRPDRIVLSMNDTGLDLILRLDNPPDWAAPGCNDPARDILQGPPRNMQDFVNFISALATRYRGRIRAYEIWNEPNLAREWCGQAPSGAAYTQMLKVAYAAVKAADPAAWVVSAGLSPTTRNDNVARPDAQYLQELYAAGAGKYFDLLGAHGAGFRAPPEADPAAVARDPNLGNPGDFTGGVPEELRRVYCFRHVEDLRAVMVTNGDTKKQVAVLEFGWTSDTVHPNYAWFAVSEQTKADYMVRAYKYAVANWTPWIGLMSLIYISDPDWTQKDEQYWWAITNPDGSPRPAYNALKAMDKPIK
jgi:hypothetical protein